MAHLHKATPAQAPGATDATPEAPSDAELVAAARADIRNVAPLYDRYVTPIFRYCYRNTSDPDLAADLTTVVFTRAIEALGTFRDRTDSGSPTGSTFRAWLYRIAHNAVIDARRRARPTVPLDPTYHHDRFDDDYGPEERAVHADELHRLLAVLDRIPHAQRQIIELRLAGLTAAEIATSLSMSRAAVKSAQTRAYTALRELLAPPGTASASRGAKETTR